MSGAIEVVTEGVESTAGLGEELALGLRAGDIVLLSGPLGAGKTAFVRGVVAGLDPAVAPLVTSQSYVIIGQYPTSPPVLHLDLYRLSDPEEVLALGYQELLYGEDRIVLCEWPDLLAPLLEEDDPVLEVRLEPWGAPERRRLTASSQEPRLIEAFKAAASGVGRRSG